MRDDEFCSALERALGLKLSAPTPLVRRQAAILDVLNAALFAVPNSQHPIPDAQLIPGQGRSHKMCLQLVRTLSGVVASIHSPRGGRKASIFFDLDDLLRGIYALQKPGDV